MEARDRQFEMPGLFGFRECRGCGLVTLSPRPTKEALASYYPPSYYSFQPDKLPTGIGAGERRVGSEERQHRGVRHLIRSLCLSTLGYDSGGSLRRACGTALFPVFGRRATYGYTDFPRYVRHGRALDIGCGSGQFLAILRHHGWTCRGVDPSATAAAAAERAHGLSVTVGEVTDLDPSRESFDFINASHVIEHMRDPLRALRAAAALLSANGKIYIETPNARSFNARVLGRYWFHWDAPRHLYVFEPATLTLLAREAGLVVRSLETREMLQVYRLSDEYRLSDGAPRDRGSGWRRVLGRGRLVGRALPGCGKLGGGDTIHAWLEAPRVGVAEASD